MADLESNNMNRITFNPKILKDYFSDFVRFLCKSCKRYNNKHNCPPFLPSPTYYKQILSNYDYGILIYKKFEIDDIKNWKTLGIQSSLEIHNELYLLKNQITSKRKPVLLSAGSCKLCSECTIPCKHPDKALIPVEATGIDVIKLFKDLTGIELKFPVEEQGYFYRIGLYLYD